MITIFANMRINEEDRLQHMKDSLPTFKDLSDNWVINVRGKLRLEAISYLKQELGDKLTLFELLDDKRGWIANAREMLGTVKYKYIFIWLEDHLNMAPMEVWRGVIKEMEARNADYLQYSWWIFGKQRLGLEKIEYEKGQYVDTVLLTKEKWQVMQNAGNQNYLISLLGIFKKDFFSHLLDIDEHKFPLTWKNHLYRFFTLLNRLGWRFDQKKAFYKVNKIFFNKFRRFTYEAPFDLEKGPMRTDVLPLKVSFPKQELFACIDDDLGIEGYQLIKRGLYPFPTLPVKLKVQEVHFDENKFVKKKVLLQPEESYGSVYFTQKNRTVGVLSECAIVREGKVYFENKAGKVLLEPGEVIEYPTNIYHKLKALDKAELDIYEAKI